MKLYHGTSERHVPAILTGGLKPRGRKKGNWQHSIESCPDAVYLTNAYALHYAYSACNPDNKSERLAILEIDTDKLDIWSFAPDEDWLEQNTRQQAGDNLAPIGKPMKYRTRWYRKRLLNFHQFWRNSLDRLGNCTYHGVIPAAAITRIAYVDQQTNADLIWVGGLDPQISLMNYAIVGGKYRDAMRRLFDATVEVEDNFAHLRSPEERISRAALLAEIWGRVETRALQ